MDWNTLDFEKAANAILILIVGVGGFFGLNQARKKGVGAGPETMEIAGAVINGKDAKMLADSFEKMSANAVALQLEMVEHRKALNRNTDAARDVHDATNHVNQEMRNLSNALLLSRK